MQKGIPINAALLKWARETAGYSLEQLVEKFPHLSRWEEGLSYPSYSKLEALAKVYKRPVIIFFFPTPPEELAIEKSLRAISEEHLSTLTPTVRFLFRKAKAFQIYLKELLADDYGKQEKKLAWLRQNIQEPDKLAQNIRNLLHTSVDTQLSWQNIAQALEEWRDILAKNGVFVFKEAFRDNRVSGFCIYDDFFPVIFVNNSQSKSRQIFTIFHELAHLIFRQNYLDVFDESFWILEKKQPSHIEIKCNNFAGHFLVPDDDFVSKIPKTFNANEIQKLAEFYKVSKEVILKKLLDHKKISNRWYFEKIKEWKNEFEKRKEEKINKKGGDYYRTKLQYLGDSYFSLVLKKYYQGKINIQQASEYLDIKVKSFLGLEEAFLKKEISI